MYFDPSVDYRTVRETGYVPGGILTRLFFALLRNAFLLFGRRPRERKQGYRRIVVVKLGGLGDAILATTVMRPLKTSFPRASIDVVCYSKSNGAFQGNPAVRAIFFSPLFDAEDLVGLGKGFSIRELREAKRFLNGADLILFLNRISSIGGFLKYWLIAILGRTGLRVGLDTRGRGIYLDVNVHDPGFLVKHEVEFARDILEALGCVVTLEQMRTHVSVGSGEKEYVRRLLDEHSLGDFIVMHPGSSLSGWRARKRIDVEVWRILIEKVTKRYRVPVVLAGTKEDDSINRELIEKYTPDGAGGIPVVNLAGITTVSQLANLISRAILFIGTDSGVAHVASCTDTPLITIFVFSDFIGFAPWSRNSHVLSSHLDCMPCLYWGGYLYCENKMCLEVHPEHIFCKVEEILGKAGRDRFPEGEVDRTGN